MHGARSLLRQPCSINDKKKQGNKLYDRGYFQDVNDDIKETLTGLGEECMQYLT